MDIVVVNVVMLFVTIVIQIGMMVMFMRVSMLMRMFVALGACLFNVGVLLFFELLLIVMLVMVGVVVMLLLNVTVFI